MERYSRNLVKRSDTHQSCHMWWKVRELYLRSFCKKYRSDAVIVSSTHNAHVVHVDVSVDVDVHVHVYVYLIPSDVIMRSEQYSRVQVNVNVATKFQFNILYSFWVKLRMNILYIVQCLCHNFRVDELTFSLMKFDQGAFRDTKTYMG